MTLTVQLVTLPQLVHRPWSPGDWWSPGDCAVCGGGDFLAARSQPFDGDPCACATCGAIDAFMVDEEGCSLQRIADRSAEGPPFEALDRAFNRDEWVEQLPLWDCATLTVLAVE